MRNNVKKKFKIDEDAKQNFPLTLDFSHKTPKAKIWSMMLYVKQKPACNRALFQWHSIHMLNYDHQFAKQLGKNTTFYESVLICHPIIFSWVVSKNNLP